MNDAGPSSSSQVRIFLATSLDGFIAGPGDDLSWLPEPDAGSVDSGYAEHMSKIGCLLFGRRTYDVVQTLGGWSYPPIPMLVATRRPLETDNPHVRAVSGDIEDLIARAREAAQGKDVYLDGGHLIRQALDAGLVDHLIVTMIPIVLGEGIPLFAGCKMRHPLELQSHRQLDQGMVQLTYRPAGGADLGGP